MNKIRIDRLSEKVIASMGPPDSGRRIDKNIMRELLGMGTRERKEERDLELYVLETGSEAKNILVLDNELPIYNTTIPDVVMRRSPIVKEILSIRNAIRILNDSDVRVSKKNESVRTIQRECVGRLDLSFEESDIAMIEKEGAASLENGYGDGVAESLSLFAELLSYDPPPKPFRVANHKIVGQSSEGRPGETRFGPMAMYSFVYNSLKLIDEEISTFDKGKTAFFQQVAAGKEKPSEEGAAVFGFLRKEVMRKMRAGEIRLT